MMYSHDMVSNIVSAMPDNSAMFECSLLRSTKAVFEPRPHHVHVVKLKQSTRNLGLGFVRADLLLSGLASWQMISLQLCEGHLHWLTAVPDRCHRQACLFITGLCRPAAR